MNLSVGNDLEISFVGPIVRKRPEELPPAKKLKEKYEFDRDKKLIYAAISGPGKSREKINELLEDSLKDIGANVLIVRGKPGSEYIKKSGNVTIRDWVENRLELLKACDVVISRSGHGTISETVVYGKPSILIPQPNQPEQEVNARGMEKLGLGKVLRQQDLNPNILKKTLDEVLEDEEIQKKLIEMQRLSKKYSGAERIADTILEFKG